MYYSFDDLYEGLILESLAQLCKLTSGVVVIDNNVVVEKCKSREEVTKQGVVYDFGSKESKDVYLIWKDITMANQTYNIPPADIDADFFEDEMIDDYPKCTEDDIDWSELDEVLCQDVKFEKKTVKEYILDYLNLIDRYNEWLFNELEYPDIDIENESAPNEFLMFFEEEFRNKIRCEKCGSIIDARNWKNLGGYIDEHAIGVRYLKSLGKITNCRKVSCPVCGNIKEIDNKYIVSPEDKVSASSNNTKHVVSSNFESLDELFNSGSDIPDDLFNSDSLDELFNSGSDIPDDLFNSDSLDELFNSGSDIPDDLFNSDSSSIDVCDKCGKVFCIHRYPFK